jgi:hypothetical protein
MALVDKVGIIDYSMNGECEGGKGHWGKGSNERKVKRRKKERKKRGGNGGEKRKWNKRGLSKLIVEQDERGR